MGQGWGCECLQAVKVIRKPEAPALPLLQAETGKLWRYYASIFLAGIWVRIPFPAGCSRADEPWQSLLPGTCWMSPAPMRGEGCCYSGTQRHPHTGLGPSCAVAAMMWQTSSRAFVSLDEETAGRGASEAWQQLHCLYWLPPGTGERWGPFPFGELGRGPWGMPWCQGWIDGEQGEADPANTRSA